MERDLDRFRPETGMSVYGSDNEKVGDIDTVEQDYFIVRKGFFFPEDHYIPMDAVSSVDGDTIYLGYTRDEVLEQRWTTEPVGTAATTGIDRDIDTPGGDDMERDGEPFVHGQDTQRTHVNEEDDLRVDIHEEDLVARRREVDRGAVRIEKDVIEEEQSIDVPVTEEHVEVTRRAVDRDASVGDTAFQEGTIEVPVHGEEVDVEKRTHVVEEVDIDKSADTHTERVRDTVRREEIEIEGEEVGRRADDTPRR